MYISPKEKAHQLLEFLKLSLHEATELAFGGAIPEADLTPGQWGLVQLELHEEAERRERERVRQQHARLDLLTEAQVIEQSRAWLSI